MLAIYFLLMYTILTIITYQVCNQGAEFTSNAWCTWGRDTITAKIPANTPNGEYLVRFEHIGEFLRLPSLHAIFYCHPL